MRGRSSCDDFCGHLLQAFLFLLVSWLGLGLALAGTVSCGCLVLWLRPGLANPNPNLNPNPNPNPNRCCALPLSPLSTLDAILSSEGTYKLCHAL